MKTIIERLEKILTIDNTDTNEIIIKKIQIYELLVSICDSFDKEKDTL